MSFTDVAVLDELARVLPEIAKDLRELQKVHVRLRASESYAELLEKERDSITEACQKAEAERDQLRGFLHNIAELLQVPARSDVGAEVVERDVLATIAVVLAQRAQLAQLGTALVRFEHAHVGFQEQWRGYVREHAATPYVELLDACEAVVPPSSPPLLDEPAAPVPSDGPRYEPEDDEEPPPAFLTEVHEQEMDARCGVELKENDEPTGWLCARAKGHEDEHESTPRAVDRCHALFRESVGGGNFVETHCSLLKGHTGEHKDEIPF